MSKNAVLPTEFVRQAIRRVVVKPYLDPSGDLPAFFPFYSKIEQSIESAIEYSEQSSHLNLAPKKIREVVGA